jgi:hypothetical protein
MAHRASVVSSSPDPCTRGAKGPWNDGGLGDTNSGSLRFAESVSGDTVSSRLTIPILYGGGYNKYIGNLHA